MAALRSRLLSAIAIVIACLSCSKTGQQDGPHNVVIIVSDALRQDVWREVAGLYMRMKPEFDMPAPESEEAA